MPQNVALPAGAKVVTVDTVTNRDKPVDALYAYSADRNIVATYASFDIAIPPGHKTGAIEWARSGERADPSDTFVTLARMDLDRRSFSSTHAPDAEGLYVHGFNTNFQEALYRAAQLSADMDIDGDLVLFAWPSEGQATAYLADRDAADFSRDALAELMIQLVDARASSEPLPVLAHSMGARLTMEALRQLSLTGRKDVIDRLEVVLAAPDIDLDLFQEQMSVIGKTRYPVSIFVSSDDQLLGLSSRLSAGRPRVGQLDVTDPSVQAMALRLGLRVIDITSQPSDEIAHSRYVGLVSSNEARRVRASETGLQTSGVFVFDWLGLVFHRS
ncbi:alpha/beta hydrolase [Celeribacter sp. ULVN23_4]